MGLFVAGSTSIQDKSLMHLVITAEFGWPIRLCSQNTSCSIFELVGVLESFVVLPCWLLMIILSEFAFCTVGLCVGFFVGICFSLKPGGGGDAVTLLVVGHSAAMRC